MVRILSVLLLLVVRMKSFKLYIVAMAVGLMAVSCGVEGDPRHCYVSIDWEYYNEDYGVYYYEDNNPDVPDLDEIEPGWYYESYPGVYDYYYESEDPDYFYDYTGFYELFQNPGTAGGLLHDGLDGADTYFDLYLFVRARKGLDGTGGLKSVPSGQPGATTPSAIMAGEGFAQKLSDTGRTIQGEPLRVETREWEQAIDNWTLRVEETVRVYKK
jgi:hypothetical protein